MFTLLPSHAYIFLVVPFLIIWLVLYLVKKSTRGEQVLMSYVGAVIGPLSEIIYFKDYWYPESIFSVRIGSFPLMLEDVLFGFAIGGIGAVVFEVLFRRNLKRLSTGSQSVIKIWSAALLFLGTLFAALSFGINSIYASSLAFLAAAVAILVFRRDLLLNAVGSGACVMLLMFVSYFLLFNLVENAEALLREQWLLYGTFLDTRVAGIPLTEMAWGFTWGFVAGPLYEFLVDKRNVKANA